MRASKISLIGNMGEKEGLTLAQYSPSLESQQKT